MLDSHFSPDYHSLVKQDRLQTLIPGNSQVTVRLRESQKKDLWHATKLCATAFILLVVVFVTPDAGQMNHKSFFAVAMRSPWSRFFDWAASWCSVKIIVLSVAVLLAFEAVGGLLLTRKQETAALAVLALYAFSILLLLFGFYELVKAML